MITCIYEDQKTAHLRHVTLDAIIVQADKLLMVKRKPGYFIEGGKFALPGGYLERDESATQGISREVLEETGFRTTKTTLFQIIDRPRLKGDDRQNVAFVFLASVGQKIQSPDFEITSLHWFALTKLPDPETVAFDHYDMIQTYLKYIDDPFPLPLINDMV